jgi:phage tail-like protein
MATTPSIIPLHVFRFQVEVVDDDVDFGPLGTSTEMCFAECTGLEATMEAKSIKEGGRNYGTAQRAGGVTFATVVLKRGVSENRDLWKMFNGISCGQVNNRLQVTITLLDGTMQPILRWQLIHAMPVKFKFADFNAKGTEVGIEELHFVHEGLVAA